MSAHSHVTPTLRLGLTGGIGSGKSSVAAMLVKRGAALVDADAIARSVTLHMAWPYPPSPTRLALIL
jgi:predicted ATPase